MNRLGLRRCLVALTALLVNAVPVFAVGVNTGFLASNPQIFPVGDLVDINAIQDNTDFDWNSLPDIIFFQITATSQEQQADSLVILHVDFSFGSTELIRWWSREFPLKKWIEAPEGSHGYFTNRQLGRLQETDWLHEDSDLTYYADTGDFLSVLDGSRVSAGIATIRIELYKYDVDTDSRGALIATMSQTVQVYNPSAPSLQQPEDGAEISSYPIFFTWNWAGGPLTTSDITLTIIEGSPGDDGETVMDTRNPSKVRFSGNPQFTNNHTYTGIAGGEQAFENGKTYFWQVTIKANSAVPGQSSTFDSNIYSFTFNSGSQAPGASPGVGGGQNPVLAQLQSILPPELVAQLAEELEGYTLTSITVDGVGGYQLQDLTQFINPQATSIMSVTIE